MSLVEDYDQDVNDGGPTVSIKPPILAVVEGILLQGTPAAVSTASRVYVGDIIQFTVLVDNSDSFTYHDAWFQGPRGPAIIASLYRLDVPCILIRNNQWKVFALNQDRDRITTYPYDEEDECSFLIDLDTCNDPRAPGKTLLRSLKMADLVDGKLPAVIESFLVRLWEHYEEFTLEESNPAEARNIDEDDDEDREKFSIVAEFQSGLNLNGKPVTGKVNVWAQYWVDANGLTASPQSQPDVMDDYIMWPSLL